MACAAAHPDVDVGAEPIVGGTTDGGHDPAVALVRIFDAQNFEIATCSGVLITPRVVMTAGHCASGQRGDASYIVAFTDTYDPKTGAFTGFLGQRGVTAKWLDPSFDERNLANGYDMALLRLDLDAPNGIQPLPIDRTRIVAPGTPVRMVGFGMTGPDAKTQVRVKLTAESHVTVLEPIMFTVDGTMASPCNGDSGGPALALVEGTEVVSGLVSYGDASCMQFSGFTFVERLIGNVDAFVRTYDPASYGVCGADGQCGFGCAEPDPDCPCAADGTCSTACPDTDLDPDCAVGCGADGVCNRTGCPFHDPDCLDMPTGSACSGANDCASAHCVAYDTGRICVPGCDGSGGCPAGFDCSAADNTCLPAGGGCAVGGSGQGGAWLALLLALRLGRRRHQVANRRQGA
jgi:hypothetical protein